MDKENKEEKPGFFSSLKAKLRAFFSRKGKNDLIIENEANKKELGKPTGLNALANEVKNKEFDEIKKAKKRKKARRKITKKTVEELKKTVFGLKHKITALELDLANKKIGEEEFKRKMAETQTMLKLAELQDRNTNTLGLHPLHAKIKERVDAPRLERIEQKLDNLAEKHNVPEQEIQEHVEKVDVNKVLKSIDNLASMVELEKKSKQIEKLPVIVDPEHFGHSKNKEEIKTIAMDIKKNRIITDVDKILSMAQEKKKLTHDDVKSLGISQKNFNEYANILKQEGLVELNYSPLGSVYLKYIEHTEEE